MIKKEVLLKIAGNPKRKRYWQMLKRLHGGTEQTMKSLGKSRDFGIYHGTEKESVPKILKKGLLKSEHDPSISHIKGVFFGDKPIADNFSKAKNLNKEYVKKFKSRDDVEKVIGDMDPQKFLRQQIKKDQKQMLLDLNIPRS
jgi:hypothetical protein